MGNVRYYMFPCCDVNALWAFAVTVDTIAPIAEVGVAN